eukprot:6827775-Prymnesium_polylepis.1
MVAPRTWAPPGYPKIFTPRGAVFVDCARAVRSGSAHSARHQLSRATHSSSLCPPKGNIHSDRRLTHPRMSYKLMLSAAVCVAAAAVRR